MGSLIRRSLILAMLVIPAPAVATVDMLLPVAVERNPEWGGWVLLTYVGKPFAPGEVRLEMFCLRAVGPLIANAPDVTALAESATPRKDKLDVAVTAGGFLPIEGPDLPAYVTKRVEHLGSDTMVYRYKLWARPLP